MKHGFKEGGDHIKNITENILGKIIGMKLRASSGTKNDHSSTLNGQSTYQNEKLLHEFQFQKDRIMTNYGKLWGKL